MVYRGHPTNSVLSAVMPRWWWKLESVSVCVCYSLLTAVYGVVYVHDHHSLASRLCAAITHTEICNNGGVKECK